MVATRIPKDLGEHVEWVTKRVRELEQRTTSSGSTALPTDPAFNTVTVDGNVLDTSIGTPTAVGVTSGIFLDQVWIDATWTAPSGVPANEYQVEVAQKISGSYQAPQQIRTSGTSLRVDGLLPNATYGVRVYAINRLGIISVAAGNPANTPTLYKDVVTAVDTTTPTTVVWGVTPALGAGLRSLMAVWTDSTDFDFDVYELQIATNAGFTTGVRSAFFRGAIGGFTDLAVATTYFVRVRPYDSSGNVGAWSSPAPASVATTTLQAGDVPPLYIASAMIQDAAILTAKIGDAQITDAKIVTLTVAKVTAGTITSRDYVLGAGGQIKTAGINPGFIINSGGISFYNPSGVQTIFLNASTGSGTFFGTISAGTTITSPVITGGTIRTSSSNPRVELSGGDLRVYDSGGTVIFQVGTTNGYMLIPGSSAGGLQNGFRLAGTAEFLTLTNGGSSTPSITFRLSDTANPYIIFGSVTNVDRLEYERASRVLQWTGPGGQGSFRVRGAVAGQNDFSGEYGTDANAALNVGAGIRGRTGHTVSLRWDGEYLAFYVDNGGAQVVLGGGTITNVGSHLTTNGTKTFVIGHPNDPKRYLVHAAPEGPTADVFYRGRARLQDGSAMVRLPGYFDALTIPGSATVQVQPIYRGYDGPTIMEPGDVFEGVFTVTLQEGDPSAEFFYEVTAERKGTRFDVEPLREQVRLHGDGPYRYLTAA